MEIKKKIKLVQVNSRTKVFVRDDTPDENCAKSNLNGDFDILNNLLSNLKSPFNILDLGGYIGTAALEFSRLEHSNVVSLEPMPDNFSILKMNTIQFNNIISVNAAIGNKSGKIMISDRGTGEWGRTIVKNPFGLSVKEVQEVDVLTFDEIRKKYLDNSFPLVAVKIDIEGGEKELFENGDWLENVPIIFAELHDRIIPGCVDAWKKRFSKLVDRINLIDGERYISIDLKELEEIYNL